MIIIKPFTGLSCYHMWVAIKGGGLGDSLFSPIRHLRALTDQLLCDVLTFEKPT